METYEKTERTVKVPCRLLTLDLDGTLLNSDHDVSPGNIETLQAAERQGVMVTLVSGRMHQSILPTSRKIGLSNPIISYNGGMVKHAETNEVYFHRPVPRPTAVRLIEYCEQADLHLNFSWNDQLYVKELNDWSQLYQSRTGVVAEATGGLLNLPEVEPTKMQVLVNPELIVDLFAEFQRQFDRDLYITRTMPEYIEFMNPQVSKGDAIIALADRLGIPIAETMAFGDGFNDESMMRTAGFSVAMANAVDEIKRISNYVTTSNDEDGVAKAVQKLVLN